MEALFPIFLVLIAALAATTYLARRLNIAQAILALLTGIALAYVPGMPPIELPPDAVLLGVLPPLIYSASVAMSWREFRASLRLISLLAIGCVIFTACAVATATHLLIGLPWGVGFLLGAIVAPPDVVAPLAVARKLGLPRRMLVVLEGEGLANDATTDVHGVGDELPREGEPHTGGDIGPGAILRLRRRRPEVRCHDDLGQLEQRAVGARFGGEHVETRAGELAG